MNDDKTKHLEDAFLKSPVASANDCTGYVNTPAEDEYTAENLSDMLRVPVPVQDRKTNYRKHRRKRK